MKASWSQWKRASWPNMVWFLAMPTQITTTPDDIFLSEERFQSGLKVELWRKWLPGFETWGRISSERGQQKPTNWRNSRGQVRRTRPQRDILARQCQQLFLSVKSEWKQHCCETTYFNQDAHLQDWMPSVHPERVDEFEARRMQRSGQLVRSLLLGLQHVQDSVEKTGFARFYPLNKSSRFLQLRLATDKTDKDNNNTQNCGLLHKRAQTKGNFAEVKEGVCYYQAMQLIALRTFSFFLSLPLCNWSNDGVLFVKVFS